MSYETVHPHGIPRRVRVRRVCCLRYRLPDTTMCYTCPRIESDERVKLIERLEAPR